MMDVTAPHGGGLQLLTTSVTSFLYQWAVSQTNDSSLWRYYGNICSWKEKYGLQASPPCSQSINMILVSSVCFRLTSCHLPGFLRTEEAVVEALTNAWHKKRLSNVSSFSPLKRPQCFHILRSNYHNGWKLLLTGCRGELCH